MPAGQEIRADFRNGENFKGTQLAYFSRSSNGLEVVGPGGRQSLSPRDGDRPAIQTTLAGPGLYVLAHETTLSRLTYKEWEKWQKFVAKKDLGAVAANHDARGLPRENFKEGYTRHAKALVAVGSGAGEDRRLGHQTEFIALNNPYAAGYNGAMRVQLYYDGDVRRNAQVEVFEEAPGGKVALSKLRTNSDGIATLRTKPGHRYLVNAVVLRDPRLGAKKVVWETLWASLTFKHPG